jgi:uncharacterized protein (DUF885 family)
MLTDNPSSATLPIETVTLEDGTQVSLQDLLRIVKEQQKALQQQKMPKKEKIRRRRSRETKDKEVKFICRIPEKLLVWLKEESEHYEVTQQAYIEAVFRARRASAPRRSRFDVIRKKPRDLVESYLTDNVTDEDQSKLLRA